MWLNLSVFPLYFDPTCGIFCSFFFFFSPQNLTSVYSWGAGHCQCSTEHETPEQETDICFWNTGNAKIFPSSPLLNILPMEWWCGVVRTLLFSLSFVSYLEWVSICSRCVLFNVQCSDVLFYDIGSIWFLYHHPGKDVNWTWKGKTKD